AIEGRGVLGDAGTPELRADLGQRHELDGCAEGIAHRAAEQAATIAPAMRGQRRRAKIGAGLRGRLHAQSAPLRRASYDVRTLYRTGRASPRAARFRRRRGGCAAAPRGRTDQPPGRRASTDVMARAYAACRGSPIASVAPRSDSPTLPTCVASSRQRAGW